MDPEVTELCNIIFNYITGNASENGPMFGACAVAIPVVWFFIDWALKPRVYHQHGSIRYPY